MAQPSQVLPPWLTPSVEVVTNAAGAPVSTVTDIVYVPPTYYGPSIPLGTIYSYGGYSYPPTVILPSAPQTTPVTTVAPSITTTATSPSTTPFTTIATPSNVSTRSSATTLSSAISIIIPTPSSISFSAPLTTQLTTTAISSSPTPSSVSNLSSPSSSATPTTSVIIPITSISLPALSTFSLSLSSSLISSTLITTSSSSAKPSSHSALSTSTVFATPTSPVGPVQATGLSKGQLVGIVVASILGLIFLFVLALFLYLWCKGRRNRSGFVDFSALDEDYYIIPQGGRLPGEGSPRHSGEEADPFLQRSSAPGWAGAAAAGAAFGAAGAATTTRRTRGQSASRPPVGRVPAPANGSGSSADSNSNASGFGELLDRPSLGMLPSMPEHVPTGGTALSDADMERISHENVLPDDPDQYGDTEYSGAYAYFSDPLVPPRLISGDDRPSPSFLAPRPPFVPRSSHLSHKGSFSGDAEESATLLTARRVKVEDLGPRSAPDSSPTRSGSSSGLLGALNLTNLANIGRMGWFKSPRQSIAEPEYSAAPLSEKDIETGRSALTAERAVDSFGIKPRGIGAGPDGTRPMSNVSARSATSAVTVYHDATSSLPATPMLATLPRAVTPAEQPPPPVVEHTLLSSPLSSPPPAYNDRSLTASTFDPVGSPTATSFSVTPGTDILDLPAPTALNRFSSISSLKETPTGSSFALFPPPGLDTIRPIGWSDTSGSIGSVAMLARSEHLADMSIDVLEDGPPDAEQGWRTISSGIGGGGFVDPGRRGTFGLLVDGAGFMSEQGSMHSMHSHLSRSIHGSSGSAPSSGREIGSINSNSSRPSAYSVARSQGSGYSVAQSLVRTGSISSDERKRGSPALSAFGLQTRAAASSRLRSPSPSPFGYPEVPVLPGIGSPPSVHMSPDKASTIRSMGSGSTTTPNLDTSFGSTVRGSAAGRSVSPLSASFPLNAPWVGGLDNEWQPSA